MSDILFRLFVKPCCIKQLAYQLVARDYSLRETVLLNKRIKAAFIVYGNVSHRFILAEMFPPVVVSIINLRNKF